MKDEVEFAEQLDRLTRQRCPAYQTIARCMGPLGVDVKVACPRKIPFGRLACPHHWSQLPIDLRRLITHAWELRPSHDGAAEEHEHWKAEAFRYWATGTWNADSNWEA